MSRTTFPSIVALLMFFVLISTVTAWSFTIPSNINNSNNKVQKKTTLSSPSDASPMNTRRSFLTTIGTTSTVAAVTTFLIHPSAAVAATGLTPDAALQQWKESVTTINNLCENWETVTKGGGDAIRKELGTANFGTVTSPLFQIDKAFKVLRQLDSVDIIEFTEQTEELSNALARADTMAYSANFAGGSGKPTPPQVYIDKAKKEVLDVQRIAKSVSTALNL